VGFSIYLGKLGVEERIMALQYCIAWIPCNAEFSENRLFDLSMARDNAIERFVEANKAIVVQYFSCNTIDLCDLSQVDMVVFYGLAGELNWLIKAIKNNPQVRLINIPLEPPVVSPLHRESILPLMPFDRMMVWNDRLAARGLPFVKANIGEAVIPQDSVPSMPWSQKRFLAAIYSNKLIKHEHGLYEERVRAFDFFSEQPEGFDLYGVGWDQSTRPSCVASYRGKVETKKDVLKNYKFSICFENAIYLGFITEKIFDCFAAGTVPIYYGAPNVQDYIPKACFIDFREFSSYETLHEFLTEMDEDTYQFYRDAVKEFLATPAYYEFTSKRYAEIVLEQIQSVMREPAPHRTVLGFKWSLLKIVLKYPLYILRNLKCCRRFLFDLVAAW